MTELERAEDNLKRLRKWAYCDGQPASFGQTEHEHVLRVVADEEERVAKLRAVAIREK